MPDGSFPLIEICRGREPFRVAPTGDPHHNMATPPPGSTTQVPTGTCAEQSVARPDPDPQNKASSLRTLVSEASDGANEASSLAYDADHPRTDTWHVFLRKIETTID
jgi:hypothetical protein